MYDYSLYEYMYVYTIFMSTFKKLSRFDLKIYKVGHKKRLAIDRDIISH
jgi:hypothetical protein